MQEGPDGNTDAVPTFWFWHPWACAGNVTGCPWVGHGNASRIFESVLVTTGRGAVLNMNIAPERTGKMNASVAAVMRDVGKALNDTFGTSVAALGGPVEATCFGDPVVLEMPPGATATVDYVVLAEDLRFGQRVANYTVEYEDRAGGGWQVLVPPASDAGLDDRPDGRDPRDSRVGHKRVDAAVRPLATIARVRFVCLRALAPTIHLRSFSVHTRRVPWEEAPSYYY